MPAENNAGQDVDPHAEKLHSRTYEQVRAILSSDQVPRNVRDLADQSAAAIAEAKVREYFVERAKGQNQQIQEMARMILAVGEMIIEERGWSKEPREATLAWCLRGEDSYFAKYLKRMQEEGLMPSGPNGFSLDFLRDGLEPEHRLSREDTSELNIEFVRRLGFIDTREELMRPEGRISWWHPYGHFYVTHPTKPFFVNMGLEGEYRDRHGQPLVKYMSIHYQPQFDN